MRAIAYLLTLALLVPRVLTQDPNHTSTADDLALLTDFLDARSNLHRGLVLFAT